MGSYLHVGVVLEASVDASKLKANGTTEEKLGLCLREHKIDPDKFERLEVDGRIKWRLKDRFAGAPFVAFLQEQDGISGLRDSKEHQREELYLEHMIHLQSERFPIASTVKLAIG